MAESCRAGLFYLILVMALSLVGRATILNINKFLQPSKIILRSKRSIKRWVAPTRMILLKRAKELEPKQIPRSQFINWNYKAELFAFSARLNENLSDETLQTALTHESYITKEEERRKALGIGDNNIPIEIQHNESLITSGEDILKGYIKPFLRIGYPFLPEEGIVAIENHLLSTEILSDVAYNLGVKDLIFCADFPPEKYTLAQTFKSLVGALDKDTTRVRSELFIQDFLLTQLVGKDVNSLWPIVNPMGIVADVLNREGRGPPEPRLIRESGRNTIMAIFNVAIYSDKQFVGSGIGETIDVAQEDAARDCLKRFFETTEKQTPLPFGLAGRDVLVCSEPNLSINEWTKEKVKTIRQNLERAVTKIEKIAKQKL